MKRITLKPVFLSVRAVWCNCCSTFCSFRILCCRFALVQVCNALQLLFIVGILKLKVFVEQLHYFSRTGALRTIVYLYNTLKLVDLSWHIWSAEHVSGFDWFGNRAIIPVPFRVCAVRMSNSVLLWVRFFHYSPVASSKYFGVTEVVGYKKLLSLTPLSSVLHGTGRPGFHSGQEQRLPPPPRTDRLWDPPCFLSSGFQG